ncbi:unnamed protein product, partial [Effrenium voratum]
EKGEKGEKGQKGERHGHRHDAAQERRHEVWRVRQDLRRAERDLEQCEEKWETKLRLSNLEHDRAMAMLRNSFDEKYTADMSQLVARHTHELVTAQAQSTQALQQKEAELRRFQHPCTTWEAHCKRLQQRAALKSKQNEKVAMESKISDLQAAIALLRMEAEAKDEKLQQQQDPGRKKARLST